MAITLPEDILFMICGELGHYKDFDSLLQCALAARVFTESAIPWLYRTSQDSPIRGGESEGLLLPQQELIVQKWAILWRSITVSSMRPETTFMPYSRFIRVLDLRDLDHLLNDDKFKARIENYFFGGPLNSFHMHLGTPSKQKTRRYRARLDVPKIVNAIGEVIYKTSPMLEQITGNVDSQALARWAPSLNHLRSLELWDGRVLESAETRRVIQSHCPSFESLSIYTWSGDKTQADASLAAFCRGLAANSLRSFEVINDAEVGEKTFEELNHHRDSLTGLKLCLMPEALPQLSKAKHCTSIQHLQLSERTGFARTDIQASNPDEFNELITWLGNCKDLQVVNFGKLFAGPALIKPVLQAGEVQLQEMELDSYRIREMQELHLALPQQHEIRSLSLMGDYEEVARFEIEIFTHALCRLSTLRELKLHGLSDQFTDDEIIVLLQNLPELEDLNISGATFTDAVLPTVSSLRRLKSVTFNTLTTFSFDGLMEFITRLQSGNQGISFLVDMADPENGLSESEQSALREEFLNKIGGRFEYQFLRDPDVSEFETDSD